MEFKGAESGHGGDLASFVKWCDDNILDLNVSKTKELVSDFRKNCGEPAPSTIHGEDVQIIDTNKYLGRCLRLLNIQSLLLSTVNKEFM